MPGKRSALLQRGYNAGYRHGRYLELLADGPHSHAVLMQLADLVTVQYLFGTAQCLSFTTRSCQSCQRALADAFAFLFGNPRCNGYHQFARAASRAKVGFAEAFELDAITPQPFDVFERLHYPFAAEAIQRPDHHNIKPPLRCISQHGLELLAIVRTLAAHVFHILRCNLPALPLAILAELDKLVSSLLAALLRDAGIECGGSDLHGPLYRNKIGGLWDTDLQASRMLLFNVPLVCLRQTFLLHHAGRRALCPVPINVNQIIVKMTFVVFVLLPGIAVYGGLICRDYCDWPVYRLSAFLFPACFTNCLNRLTFNKLSLVWRVLLQGIMFAASFSVFTNVSIDFAARSRYDCLALRT